MENVAKPIGFSGNRLTLTDIQRDILSVMYNLDIIKISRVYVRLPNNLTRYVINEGYRGLVSQRHISLQNLEQELG